MAFVKGLAAPSGAAPQDIKRAATKNTNSILSCIPPSVGPLAPLTSASKNSRYSSLCGARVKRDRNFSVLAEQEAITPIASKGASETSSGSPPTAWLGSYSGNATQRTQVPVVNCFFASGEVIVTEHAGHPSFIREDTRARPRRKDRNEMNPTPAAVCRRDRRASAKGSLPIRPTEARERQRVVDGARSHPVVAADDVERTVCDGAAGVVEGWSGHPRPLRPDTGGRVIDLRMPGASRGIQIGTPHVNECPVGRNGWVENLGRYKRSGKPGVRAGVIDPVVIHVPVPAEHVEGPVRKHDTVNPAQAFTHLSESGRINVGARVIYPNRIRCVEEAE